MERSSQGQDLKGYFPLKNSGVRRRFSKGARKQRRKIIAGQQLDHLLRLAVSEASKHPDLAQSHSNAAFKLATRFNIRMKTKRRLICRSCKSLIVPPAGARYRLSKRRKGMNITCLKCGKTYRVIFGS